MVSTWTEEVEVMRKSSAVGIVAAGILAMAGLSSRAEEDGNRAAPLAKAVAEARISLDVGLPGGRARRHGNLGEI